jgi:hypothetical protein
MKKILLITLITMGNFIFKTQELITDGYFSSARILGLLQQSVQASMFGLDVERNSAIRWTLAYRH